MKSFACPLALAAGLVAAAARAAPAPQDFAHGLLVADAPGAPVQQFTLPEQVYQGVTRADLGDLRVFNGGDVVVPHALCTAPVAAPPAIEELPLPVFALQRQHATAAPQDSRVSVQTPSGVSVQIVGSPALAPGAIGPPETFVVDATAAPGPLRALRLAWSTPDGASEAHVRVEASEDLNQWRSVVAGTTLLRVAADGRALDRSHIDLPEATYRYLRVVRNAGPALGIERVVADVVRPAAAPEPRWFAAMPAADGDVDGFLFDAGRLAPVHSARVGLASANMSLRVALESRAAPEQAWQLRWTGEVLSVEGAAANASFGPVTDALWRLRVLRGAETLGGGRPTLQLGYHPARLRFLAQGAGPYRIGYGSARVPPAESIGCEALLGGGTEEDLIGAATATAAPAGAFGGSAALEPPPKPTPVRQIVLWLVLLAGTAVLVAMALALLRRLREGNDPA
jgi:hypothetical protein